MSAKYSQLKLQPPAKSGYVFDYDSPFDYSSSLFKEAQSYKSAFTYTGEQLSTLDTCSFPEGNDESFASRCLRIVISCLCYLLFIMTFPISLIICLKRIPSLQRLVLIRLGKLQPVKGPGMVLVFPCIDQSSSVDLKPRTLILHPEKVLTSDGGIVEIFAEIEYQVADVINFVMRVQQLEQTFNYLSHRCLINIASEKRQSDFESSRQLLGTELQSELNRTVISWGIEIKKVEIPPVKILKPADPVDVVGTIVSSLKPVLGLSFKESSIKDSQKAQELLDILQPEAEEDSVMKATRNLCNRVVKKGVFKDKKLTCKLEVDDRILYCCFDGSSLNRNMDTASASTTNEENQDQKIQANGNKFFKEFYQVVGSADVVLHVLDARDPLNTRCPQVEQAVINSGTNKRLILVLNKIDLIPHQNLLEWLKYLRNEFPTVAFKASTQDQRDNLSQCRRDIKHCSDKLLQSSKCIGADMLMKLLQSYCYKDENFKKEEKATIRVGIVGFPNVGKSSIINSLKRSKACDVGCYPGVTKTPEEILLTKNIKLIDCPGVVHLKPDSSELAYVSVSKVEDIKDPETVVLSILKRVNAEQLMLEYRLPEFSSPQEFLHLLSKRLGRFKKGGIPDIESAARKFLMDWNRGRIKYFTHPPAKHQLPSYISSEIVETMSKSFDLSLLANEDDAMKVDIPVLPPDVIDVTEDQGRMDVPEENGPQVSLLTDKNKKAIENRNKEKLPDVVKELNKSRKKQRKRELKRLKKKKRRQEKISNQLSESLVAALANFND